MLVDVLDKISDLRPEFPHVTCGYPSLAGMALDTRLPEGPDVHASRSCRYRVMLASDEPTA